MRNKIGAVIVILLLIAYFSISTYQAEKTWSQISKTIDLQTIDNKSALELLERQIYRKSLSNLSKAASDSILILNTDSRTITIYDRGIINFNGTYYLIVFKDSMEASNFNKQLQALVSSTEVMDTLIRFEYIEDRNPMTTTDDNATALDFDLQYEALEDVNTHLIDIQRAELLLENFLQPIIKRTNDGYIALANKLNFLEVHSYGENSFTRELDYNLGDSSLNEVLVYPNGDIAILLSSWPYNDNHSNDHNLFIKLDSDGNTLAEQRYTDLVGTLFKFAYLLESGHIIAVGEIFDNQMSDIIVVELDDKGKILWKKTYGGSDFDYLMDADYTGDILFISGWTNSMDGDFLVEPIKSTYVNYMAALDLNGNFIWVKNSNFRYSEVCILNEHKILVTYPFNDNGDVFIVDYGGDIIDTKQLKNSQFAAFISSGDGGFYTVQHRPVKTLPQPLHISSIWTDDEIVFTRYDSNFNIIWRQSFNDYPDDTRLEPVYLLQ